MEEKRISQLRYDFNSRPYARGDPESAPADWMERLISIHAPTRGATVINGATAGGNRFQFTPLREGRRKMDEKAWAIIKFQFTPLREGRQGNYWGDTATR